MSILHEISQYAMLIRFEPLTSGDLHIEILMPYFVSASSSDKKDCFSRQAMLKLGKQRNTVFLGLEDIL